MKSLVEQFPNKTIRERRKPVDHGPDNVVFGRQFWRRFRDVVLICFLFAICLVVAALSAWYENVEDS